MNFKSTIEFKTTNPEKLEESFRVDKNDSDQDRSSYDIKTKEGLILFQIKAKDSVALRATLNSITKLITVYEKLK